MAKINDLDSKILKQLLTDGRTGYNEIANECGVTKNKIWKRCKTMEEKGIINGATIQINFAQFGYDALATLLISVEAQQIEKIMDFIKEIAEVRAYQQYNSVFNVRAVATLSDLNELDRIKQVIKRKLPTLGLKTYIWTGVRNIPENLNLAGYLKKVDEKTLRNVRESTSIENGTKIDEVDKQIVAKLTLDGRASFNQIANEIGISTDTVVKRYHKLRKKGAIKVSVQINPNKIGYNSILDFNITFVSINGLSDSVVEALAKIPDVIIITKTSGDFDLQVTAMVRDINEIFSIQDEITRICGVTKMESSARKIPDKWPTPRQYLSNM